MTDDFSTADTRQLEVWAFGRQSVDTDRERADAALGELARRAAVAREAVELQARAESASTDADSTGEHSDKERTTGERRLPRRIFVTGIATVAAAALALGASVVVLSQPNPDPFAVFDRAETDDDRLWAQRLVGVGLPDEYLDGPRAFELGDGFIAIASRVSTVPDGRSTEWDSLCLAVSSSSFDVDRGSLSLSCTYPERFARDGLTFAERPAQPGTGYDTVIWGPTGGPRLERNVPLEGLVGSMSVLDFMAFPSFFDLGVDPLSIINEPDRLLMGPAIVPLDVGDVGDAETPEIETFTYLLQGKTAASGSVMCAVAVVPGARETTACAPLSTVRRQGLEFTVVADAREWVVGIGADGPERRDTLRPAD